MQGLYLVLAAVVLYVVSDWIVQRAELRAGRRFEYRTLYFFFILLVLALATFWSIRQLAG